MAFPGLTRPTAANCQALRALLQKPPAAAPFPAPVPEEEPVPDLVLRPAHGEVEEVLGAPTDFPERQPT